LGLVEEFRVWRRDVGGLRVSMVTGSSSGSG
jgi:hypothetical protein